MDEATLRRYAELVVGLAAGVRSGQDVGERAATRCPNCGHRFDDSDS